MILLTEKFVNSVNVAELLISMDFIDNCLNSRFKNQSKIFTLFISNVLTHLGVLAIRILYRVILI